MYVGLKRYVGLCSLCVIVLFRTSKICMDVRKEGMMTDTRFVSVCVMGVF